MEIVLLLTACIDPQGMSNTKLQNPLTRQQQYEEALNYYLKETFFKIVFVENSNIYIGGKYQNEIEKGRLEIITFSGNNYPKERGKGYGEMLIIMKAVEQSLFLKSNSLIIKVTGRLIVSNINQICKTAISYSSKPIVISEFLNDNYFYSRVFIAPIHFFSHYAFPLIHKIDDSKSIYFESVMLEALLAWLKDGLLYSPFNYAISLCGISGTTSKVYLKKSMKHKIRVYVCYLMYKLKLVKWRLLS